MRAQVSVEFIIIFTAVFFIFILGVGAIVQFTTEITQQRTIDAYRATAETLRTYLIIADQSIADVEYTIDLPDTIRGTHYTVQTSNGLLVIDGDGYDASLPIPQTTPATYTGGETIRVTRTAGVITLA